MTAVAFEEWPKIARLNRGMVITEKIDGTNAAVVIVPLADLDRIESEGRPVDFFDTDSRNMTVFVDGHAVFSQSRNRFIIPEQDNAGFARWVEANASALVSVLGPGRHFGEWWGNGIQRRYGLAQGDKRFSLFNTTRWADTDLSPVPGLGTVPVLAAANFSSTLISDTLEWLATHGSVAAPGFMDPEGIVIYLSAARTSFKVTIKGDDMPKGQMDRELSAVQS